jgi:phosphoserine phosphatase
VTLLHVFDLDGTLLRATTASLEIARVRDQVAELTGLERALAAGDIDTRGFAAAIGALWHGLTAETVDEAFRTAPWIGGLDDVLHDIKDRGEHSAVITMSPDFFANRLTHRGVDTVFASRFPPLPMTGLPAPEGILTPADKVTLTDKLLAHLGLDRDRCIAYGDSASDIPLFAALDDTVAVNGDARTRASARTVYDGDDLTAAYHQARTHAGTPRDGHREAAAPETPHAR